MVKRGRGRPLGACVVLRACPLGCGASLGCNAMRKHVPLCRRAKLVAEIRAALQADDNAKVARQNMNPADVVPKLVYL